MSHIDKTDGRDDADAVSRAYRDARDSDPMLPPPALDDAIRAAARRKVHAGPQPMGRSWVRKWTPQMAVAAVVVLSVSVLFVSVEERPDLAPAPLQELALKRQVDANAESANAVKAKVVELIPAPAIAAATLEKKARAEVDSTVAFNMEPQLSRKKSIAQAAEEPVAMAKPAPLAPSQLAAAGNAPAVPVYAPPASPATAPAPAVVAPAPFPAAVADAVTPSRQESRIEARPSAPREAAVAEEKVAATGILRSRDNAAASARAVAPPVPATPAPATSIAPPAPAAMAKQLAPVPALAPQIAPSLAGASRKDKQESAVAGIRAFSKEDVSASEKPLVDERPGPWLKRLQELHQQGKLKELREELVRFRKAHPDVVLPKSLTELLP